MNLARTLKCKRTASGKRCLEASADCEQLVIPARTISIVPTILSKLRELSLSEVLKFSVGGAVGRIYDKNVIVRPIISISRDQCAERKLSIGIPNSSKSGTNRLINNISRLIVADVADV